MKVIIAAAGTGGHINPGLAIANKIKEQEPDSEIVFFGTPNGLENDLVPRAGYKLEKVQAFGIQPKITPKNIKQIIETYKSRKIVKKFMDSFNPDVVIGMGGYICGPVFWAAHSKKIPTVLHESNAFPGKAVKMFAKKTDKILLGFEATKEKLPGIKNVVVTGNPTKIKKINVTSEMRKRLISELGLRDDLPVVLVFGGSQGAKKINDAIIDILKNKRNEKYQFIWATGASQFKIVSEELRQYGIDPNNIKNCKMVEYIYNMQELMNVSDVIVCRSGAMTITEIAIVGKPAIFIPLPSMRANRQEDNARVLERLDAAKVILNDEICGELLNDYIEEIVTDSNKMIQMGNNANKIATYDVEEKIYKEIKSIVKK